MHCALEQRLHIILKPRIHGWRLTNSNCMWGKCGKIYGLTVFSQVASYSDLMDGRTTITHLHTHACTISHLARQNSLNSSILEMIKKHFMLISMLVRSHIVVGA